MKNFIQIIKRKKNKRCLIIFWLFLVVLELFCPMLDDELILANEPNSPSSIERTVSDKVDDLNQISTTFSANQNQNPEQCFCNDGCLCHGMGLLEFPFYFNQKSAYFRGEQTVFLISSAFFNSPTPPYPPPKLS